MKTIWLIFEDNQFMLKHKFHIIDPSTYLFLFITKIQNNVTV